MLLARLAKVVFKASFDQKKDPDFIYQLKFFFMQYQSKARFGNLAVDLFAKIKKMQLEKYPYRANIRCFPFFKSETDLQNVVFKGAVVPIADTLWQIKHRNCVYKKNEINVVYRGPLDGLLTLGVVPEIRTVSQGMKDWYVITRIGYEGDRGKK